MADDLTLSEHLLKLIAVKSEQKLENLLQLLWQTRKTGLSNSQKSSIHSLFNLPSLRDLDPILACLRSLIRNYVHKNLEGDEALKLLPADLPLELQSMLLVLLRKHRSRWKDELSLDSHASGWTRSSHQVNVGLSAPILPCSSSAVSGLLSSLQVDPAPHFNSPNIGGPTPIAERNVACFPHFTLQNDVGPTEIQGVLPQVKSMTWTVENKGEIPTNRVAIITLKLHDYTKSPLNEMEVKFQLTRDTLEAVLRSMAYISEQLSQFVSLIFLFVHGPLCNVSVFAATEYGIPHFLPGQILFKTVTEETKAMTSQVSSSISGVGRNQIHDFSVTSSSTPPLVLS